MEAFSGLLLKLYRQAQSVTPEQFQTLALDASRDALAFDSAVWITGVMGAEGGIVHSACLYRQPTEMMQSYERIKQHDTLAFETFSRMGQTVNAALSTDPQWLARLHPDVLAHIKRYGMAHVLTTHLADPVLRLFTAVALYRADPAQPFNEAERLFKQNLMPHLVETLNSNRFNYMQTRRDEDRQADHARAICDKKGILYNACQNFSALMFAEWPDWHGPQLPRALLDALCSKNPHHFTGRGVVATIKSFNDMLLLGLRKKSSVDQLSRRELEVARCYGQGLDYREIAQELHIAPVTVRNHLQAIYATLGVSNKVEMSRMILGADEQ